MVTAGGNVKRVRVSKSRNDYELITRRRTTEAAIERLLTAFAYDATRSGVTVEK